MGYEMIIIVGILQVLYTLVVNTGTEVVSGMTR